MSEYQPEVVRDRELDVWQRVDSTGYYRCLGGKVVATFDELQAAYGPLQEPEWRDV